MSQRLEEMPLFLLNTVVFPYADLQVHIFEDRYKEMINRCMQYDQGFGVVLIRSGSEVGGTAEPYMVGTACRIEKVQSFDDGKMDVWVKGERRFRIRKLDHSHPYLVGMVEQLVEMEPLESPRYQQLLTQVRQGVQRYIESKFHREGMKVTVGLPGDVTAMSFRVANLLHCENLQKQHLLESTDTEERLEAMLPLLEQQLADEDPQITYQKLSSTHVADWLSPN